MPRRRCRLPVLDWRTGSDRPGEPAGGGQWSLSHSLYRITGSSGGRSAVTRSRRATRPRRQRVVPVRVARRRGDRLAVGDHQHRQVRRRQEDRGRRVPRGHSFSGRGAIPSTSTSRSGPLTARRSRSEQPPGIPCRATSPYPTAPSTPWPARSVNSSSVLNEHRIAMVPLLCRDFPSPETNPRHARTTASACSGLSRRSPRRSPRRAPPRRPLGSRGHRESLISGKVIPTDSPLSSGNGRIHRVRQRGGGNGAKVRPAVPVRAARSEHLPLTQGA
ncbi:hypothetical protein JOF41_002917 [Saccharothrix coeruleofusca]|nr:hypothetical protein [Saccharothrix coeruleofusca]